MIFFYLIYFLMICITHVLCIGNNCVAKDNFPLTMFEMDNYGILCIYLTP